MLQPDFKQFSRLAREATLVPVVKSVSADLLTPVSAFLAIAEDEPHAFLLESAERGEQIGRYTFLGARPYMRVKAQQGTVEIERGRRREVVQENVFQVVKQLLREHRPASVPGLPPFTAGAVGYFAYDVVRQLENIGEHAKDDLGLPDAELMFLTGCWHSITCATRFTSSPPPTLRARAHGAPMTVPFVTLPLWSRNSPGA